MANMSYCRFENTFRDLEDCYDNWDENDRLSESETKYRRKLLNLCEEIVDDISEAYIVVGVAQPDE